MRKSCHAAAFAALLAAAPPAGATVLVFDQSQPNQASTNFAALSHAYGDNVAAAAQGGFTYGVGAEGFTPDVTVSYGPLNAAPATFTTGFGDLVNVLSKNNASLSPTLEVTLTAAAGLQVELYGFDLAAFSAAFQSDPTINLLQVLDQDGNALFGQANLLGERDYAQQLQLRAAARGKSHHPVRRRQPEQLPRHRLRQHQVRPARRCTTDSRSRARTAGHGAAGGRRAARLGQPAPPWPISTTR
jgi:hypothetical protein